jgi:hypothetical protein
MRNLSADPCAVKHRIDVELVGDTRIDIVDLIYDYLKRRAVVTFH